MTVLLTGTSGFIGYHLAKSLLEEGHTLVGVDNLNDYYSVQLKMDRLKNIRNAFKESSYKFYQIDISSYEEMEKIFRDYTFDLVINLAAQAGVRYSIQNPLTYVNSNVTGFSNVLELSHQMNINHVIYASSSSVYGLSDEIPYRIEQQVDSPISMYAATKKSNELMAHVYSHLHGMRTTGLRFFTVYGPWGRPDMAYYSFTKALYNGDEISIYNHGELQRDFTYIDDIITGICGLVNLDFDSLDAKSAYKNKYNIFNIGNSKPVKLMEFIDTIEKIANKPFKRRFVEMQKGDMKITYSDIKALSELIDYTPITNIDVGLQNFVEWYKEYHNVS